MTGDEIRKMAKTDGNQLFAIIDGNLIKSETSKMDLKKL